MRIYNQIYPFLSIGFIEIGNLLENLNTIATAFIFLIQFAIGLLTVVKLYRDIKRGNFKSINDLEKKIQKKYSFLSNLSKYLNKPKNLSL